MTKRVFLKLLFLIVLVVGVSTAALDIFVRRSWEASLPASLKQRIEKQLLEASGIGLLSGFVVALIGARSVSRRLDKMVVFAQEIAAGHLAARLPESGSDEIAVLATALDKTARHIEANFRNLESSRQQLETLLNSMNDAVVAVSSQREVVWFNGAMKGLAAGSDRGGRRR